MKNNVYIFGEMHTKADRDRIEKEIIELFRQGKIKYLLSEEVGDNIAMTSDVKKTFIKEKRFSISDRSYKLGIELAIPVIGIDNWDRKIYRKDKKGNDGTYIDCAYSFKLREERMVEVIKRYGDLGSCAVIVGDSHLRGLPNSIMGDVSPIQKAFLGDPLVKIMRSPISELKENNIVRVEGDSFNQFAWNEIVKLSNTLILEQRNLINQDRLKRSGETDGYYDKEYFNFPDKFILCSVDKNKIVSMFGIFLTTKTHLDLGPIYTLAEYRSQGRVKHMFNYLFDNYPKEKYGYAIGVLPANKKAYKLYEEMGFKPCHIVMEL